MVTGVRAVTVGAVVELVALLVVFETAAGGHGTYAPAKCLFPYSLALTAFAHSLNAPLLVLALLQFPGYAIIAVANRSRYWVRHSLVVVHLLAVLAAFLFAHPNFTR